jgi:hypothetical protein
MTAGVLDMYISRESNSKYTKNLVAIYMKVTHA